MTTDQDRPPADEKPDEDDFEPAARELCPDESCIGLIGPDGRCKLCGKAGSGSPPAPHVQPEPAEPTQTLGTAAQVEPAEPTQPLGTAAQGPHDPDAEAPDDGDGADRRLCPDGACIGLLGPDGRCKICGQKGEL